jgi:hypothetical protein
MTDFLKGTGVPLGKNWRSLRSAVESTTEIRAADLHTGHYVSYEPATHAASKYPRGLPEDTYSE